MKTQIDRYVAGLIAVPFAATFAIFAMLLLLVRMAELFTAVMEGGGSLLTMARLLACLAPQYLVMAIPVGLVAGVVLAFRRLALSGEWDALSGAGVSPLRLLRAPLIYALIAGAAVFVVAGAVQPRATYAGQKLLFDLAHGVDGPSVPAGAFQRLGDDTVVRARTSLDRGRDLRDVLIARRDAEGRLVVVSAGRALIAGDTVHLYQGTALTVGAAGSAVTFARLSLPMPLPPPPAFRTRGAHERELTWAELWTAARGGDRRVDAPAARAGLARRAAQSAALLALPFLAFGFARPPLRSGESGGLFIALGAFIVFNEVSLFAERMGFGGQVPPVGAQAAALLGLGAVAAVVFAQAAPRPPEGGRMPLAGFLRTLRRAAPARPSFAGARE